MVVVVKEEHELHPALGGKRSEQEIVWRLEGRLGRADCVSPNLSHLPLLCLVTVQDGGVRFTLVLLTGGIILNRKVASDEEEGSEEEEEIAVVDLDEGWGGGRVRGEEAWGGENLTFSPCGNGG